MSNKIKGVYSDEEYAIYLRPNCTILSTKILTIPTPSFVWTFKIILMKDCSAIRRRSIR